MSAADGNEVHAPAAQVHTLAVGRAAALLRDVATEQSEQADEIASTMMGAYEIEIPAYAAIRDQALVFALRHADRGYILEKGRIVHEGTAAELRASEGLLESLGVSRRATRIAREVGAV